MPVLYKPFQSTLEDKKSGKKLFYPRVVRSGNVDSAQLSKEIAAYSSLSPGDVKNTLDNLVTVMGQHLQSSESVSVDGLGTFRMVMVARGKVWKPMTKWRLHRLRLPSASNRQRLRIMTALPLPVRW